MLYSQLLGRSSKTEGSNLQVKSHRLLVQAGYIRESVAGRYYLLPLGRQVQLKLMDIVRSEMNQAGALELAVPILHPLSLWQETNRDQAVGFELMQLKDRRQTEFALGGTAEEMFIDLVRKFNLSYKDLPFNLYQFGAKFRDELRARGGLLRLREFVMKDAYSFSTEAQFTQVYEQMRQVYEAIFKRLGLEAKVVPADNGYIGGEYCHEFIVDSEAGESVYFYTTAGYCAHEDIASFDKTLPTADIKPATLELVPAQRGPTMADSHQYHQPVALTQHLKNVVYLNERHEIILACLRGDLEVNELKLRAEVACHQLQPLTNQQIKTYLNSVAGFISPVKLQSRSKKHKLIIAADDSVSYVKNAISGGNQWQTDYLNINFERDFKADVVADIALAKAGYVALDGQVLQISRGIEVGNIFQLGYYYANKMKGVEYIDQAGCLQKYYMGCYGIGIERTMATVVEVLSDDSGIIWPRSLTPYDIYLATLPTNQDSHQPALELKHRLQQAGLSVLYDDRDNVTAGEKLANADLLGFPLRIVVSPTTLAKKSAEIKLRVASEMQLIPLMDIPRRVVELLKTCP